MIATGAPGVVVADASLVGMWVLAERFSLDAIGLSRDWLRLGVEVISPCFMLAEVTNAIYKRARRGEITYPQAESAVNVILSFGIRLEEEPDLHRQALVLATRLNRPTTYDAHYLALGQLRRCEVWTGDERLFNAVCTQVPWLRWIGNYASTP